MASGWTGGQYSFWRALLGVYLFIHFVHLLPWSAELFSNEGLLPQARLSPLAAVFPGIFAINDSPWFIHATLSLAAAAAIAFAAGWRDNKLVTHNATLGRVECSAINVALTHGSMALPGVSATPIMS